MNMSSSEEDVPILPSQQQRRPGWERRIQANGAAATSAWQPMFYQQAPQQASRLSGMLQGFLMAMGAVFVLTICLVMAFSWGLGSPARTRIAPVVRESQLAQTGKASVMPTNKPATEEQVNEPAVQAPAAPATALRTAQVQPGKLNVRQTAGTDSPIVDQLYAGETIEVLEEKQFADGAVWVRMRLSAGRAAPVEGWVSAKYLR